MFSFYLINFKNSEAQLWSTRDILKTVKWIKHDNVLWPSSIMFIILTHVDVLKPITDCTYVEGRWQWRANDCVWPGSQALRWKRKRRKVSRKSPRTDFLQPPVWRLELNLKLYFLVVFGGRYDKVSESLALRILNIKNIPRNNKDVSWIQYKCGLNVLRVSQDELIFLHLFRLEWSTKPSFQFVSFLTREVRDEPIKHQTLSGANKIFFFHFIF